MDLIDGQDDLYEEQVRIEEQDLRILKAIVSDDAIAREFINNYDHNLFVGDAKPFAQKVISYYRGYNTHPTRRVMIEIAGTDQNLKDEIDFVWDELDRVEYNASEFRWDLDKIKNRYAEQKLITIREGIADLNSDTNLGERIMSIRANLDAAEKVRKGAESSYIQKTLKEYMPEFREEFVRKSKDPDLGKGLLTGYSYIDYVTNGLAPADMLIIGGETSSGKAQPLNTLIPTPDGFRLLGDIKPGDMVFGRDGSPCNVVAESKAITSVGWKFIFSDNSEAISHNNHEWLTFDRSEQLGLSRLTDGYRARRRERRLSRAAKGVSKRLVRIDKNVKRNLKQPSKGTIRTSSEIAKTLHIHKNKRRNHAIPIANAIKLPKKNLVIDPYVLGLWLGDGTSGEGAITTMDDEAVRSIEKVGYVVRRKSAKIDKDGVINKASTYFFNKLKDDLKKINVFKNKHVPYNYLWSHKEQRLALLQGLMDSDGYVSKSGSIDFVNTNKLLADAVAFLVRSLGEKCTITEGEAKLYGRVSGPKWTVRFHSNFPVFRLLRKLKRQNKTPRPNRLRYIKNATRVKAVPMKCIQVDSEDHMYLTGEDFVPTHNSFFLNNMAIQMWQQSPEFDLNAKGANIQFFSLEMPYDQCVRRTMARLSGIQTYGLRDCQITNTKQLEALAKAANFINKFPFEFEVVDIPRGVTIRTIEERYLEAVANGRAPDVVVIDYLGLMEVEGHFNVEDWLKLGYIAGQLHEFSRTYNVVVLTAVQLNRPKIKPKDPSELIGMHRIGRSSLIMHHASVGIQIETRIDEDTFSDMPYHIIKNRNGERGSHLLKKNFRNATLIDLEPYVPMHDDGVGDFSSMKPAMEDISFHLDEYGWGV